MLREQDAAAGVAIYAGTGSRLTVTDSSFSGNVAAPYGQALVMLLLVEILKGADTVSSKEAAPSPAE